MNKSLFFISRVRRTITLEARKLLYFSYVHSTLIYCLPLFTLLFKTDMNALCQLQRKAIRIVYNVKQHTSSGELFHDLGTLPLDLLLEKRILLTMHLIHSYKKPKEIIHYFPLKSFNHDYDIRLNETFLVPFIKSNKLCRSPIFAFPILFNKFSHEFKLIMEYKDFFEKLELHYISLFPKKECRKGRICKYCNYHEFKNRQQQFGINFEAPEINYLRYNVQTM